MSPAALNVWNLLSCQELVMLLRIGATIPRIHDRFNRLMDARERMTHEDRLERTMRFSRSLPSIRKAIHERPDKPAEISHLRPSVKRRRRRRPAIRFAVQAA